RHGQRPGDRRGACVAQEPPCRPGRRADGSGSHRHRLDDRQQRRGAHRHHDGDPRVDRLRISGSDQGAGDHRRRGHRAGHGRHLVVSATGGNDDRSHAPHPGRRGRREEPEGHRHRNDEGGHGPPGDGQG
ncbi:MAG: hypothetical protein ACK55I_40685, partial [bacterium]